MATTSTFDRRSFLAGAAASAAVAAAGVSGVTALADDAQVGNAHAAQEAAAANQQVADNSDWMDKLTAWREKPEEPTEFSNTYQADVVVVGAGLAGINAARSAAENGASVIVLEDGETYEVHGFGVASLNPKMAEDQGLHNDPVEYFREFTRQHGMRVNDDLIRTWCDESGPAFDWWEEILPPACEYDPDSEDYKTSYRSVLYWPSEPAENFDGEQFKHFSGGIDFCYESFKYAGQCIVDKCCELGVDFHYKTTGYMLTQDADGVVTGVIAQGSDGSYEKYEAKKGVILACGTYSLDQDMVNEFHADQVLHENRKSGSFTYMSLMPGTGAGQRMAIWAGAEMEPWQQRTSISMSDFHATPGLSINQLGKRWHNEDTEIWTRAVELENQPGRFAWEVFDSNWMDLLPYTSHGHLALDPLNVTFWTVPPKGYFTRPDGSPSDGKMRKEEMIDEDLRAAVDDPEGVKFGGYVEYPTGATYAASTLEGLAKMMFPDDEDARKNFLAEVEEYNELCDAGEDIRYGKRPALMRKIDTPPFYCSGTGPRGNSWVGEEGVTVDGKTLAVLREGTGKPIGHLWAAGATVGGRAANQYVTPMSGMNHGFCLTLGKLSGEHAAKGIE